jgi:mycothiol synthase
VGFGRIEWADDNDGSRVYFSFCLLDPAVRGRGIGRPMLEWQERRIRTIATGHVTDRPRLFASSAWDGDPGAHALLTSAGYQVVRAEAEMVRPNLEEIPEAPAPAGIEIRPGRLADARLLWAADIEIFRDHWGAVDESEASYERLISDPTLDPSLWLIAWSGGEIAGLVLSSLQPGREPGTTLGYLDNVGVRRRWRRIGLGRALVGASLRLLRDRGASSAALGVDTQNQNEAQHPYERMGFVVVSRARSYRKPLVVDAGE